MSMDTYDKLVSIAYAKVNIIVKEWKNNKSESAVTMMYALLKGIGNFAVKWGDRDYHNYQAVIDAVHKYYVQKDKDVKELYRLCFEYAAKEMITGKKEIEEIITWFNYEIMIEERGTSAFKLDMDNLLEMFRRYLTLKLSELKKAEPGMDNWLRMRSENMNRYYGKSFWD